MLAVLGIIPAPQFRKPRWLTENPAQKVKNETISKMIEQNLPSPLA
jgi:predicted DNA-binding protein (MmcQ/YjbR family)